MGIQVPDHLPSMKTLLDCFSVWCSPGHLHTANLSVSWLTTTVLPTVLRRKSELKVATRALFVMFSSSSLPARVLHHRSWRLRAAGMCCVLGRGTSTGPCFSSPLTPVPPSAKSSGKLPSLLFQFFSLPPAPPSLLYSSSVLSQPLT